MLAYKLIALLSKSSLIRLLYLNKALFLRIMKADSGSHPHLYKLGMKMYKIHPKLWDYGMEVISIPNRLQRKTKGLGPIQTIDMELSVLCNLRCSFCWWWGENGIAFKLYKERDPLVTQELSTQEIFNFIDQVAPSKPSFYLSGGEPFIRKDTVDIIEYIAKKGMSVITNNNGTVLTDDKLQRLAKIKALTINFSIDGTRDVHNKIRGMGMYEKTTSTIKKLLEYRGNTLFPAIKTNTTFSPWLLGHMDELIRELQDNVGVDAVRMQHLWFTDKEHAESHKAVLKDMLGHENDTGVDGHIITRPEPDYAEKLYAEIDKVESTRYKKPVFIHPKMNLETMKKYYGDLNFSRTSKCNVAMDHVVIKADGDVMFCPDSWIQYKIGSIRKDHIDTIWRGERAQKFREALDKVGLFPACARCCAING